MFGNLTDASGNVLIRQGETLDNIFHVQTRAAGYHLALKNSELLWAGDPCNNSGGYQEYIGFQNIIVKRWTTFSTSRPAPPAIIWR
jgi:hypothetical protein